MKLITEVELPDYPFQLDHLSPILMTGSCFAEEVGRMMEKYLFPVCINPFGVTYNPSSVLNGIRALTEKDLYREEDLDQSRELWFSFDHYTKFSDPDREKVIRRINQKFLEAKELLNSASILMITWGTAWVYRTRSGDRVVNNCHKIPAGEFSRSRLTPQEIITEYESFLQTLIKERPHLKILLTVSPVRHWKDGAHGNQLSKATLLLAAEALKQSFPENCFYFPSYEIVMDELRDYRFYGADMVHTNDLSTRYIWEKFSGALIHESSHQIIREIEPLLRMREHIPIRSDGTSYEKLVRQMNEQHEKLKQKYPDLSWNNWEQSNV